MHHFGLPDELIPLRGVAAVRDNGLDVFGQRLARCHEHRRRAHGHAVQDYPRVGVPRENELYPLDNVHTLRPAHADFSPLAFAVGARIDRKNIEAEGVKLMDKARHMPGLARISVADENIIRAGIFELSSVQPQRFGHNKYVLAVLVVPFPDFRRARESAVFCARILAVGLACHLLNEVVELAHMYGRFRVYREII